jgi:Protein of unknown function (DUF3040)
MALTEYEERVIAELEAQLQPDDAVWFERFERLAAHAPRRNIGRFAPAFACFLGGVALLVAIRNTWLVVEMANLSGIASGPITRGLGVTGCGLVLASALVLRCVVRDRRHHPR